VNKTIKMIGVVLGLAAGLMLAQVPVRLVDGSSTGVVLGAVGKPYNSGMVTTVTSGTAITALTTKVKVLFCRNNTGAAVNFSVTDAGGTVYFPSNALASNGAVLMVASDIGITMTGVTVTPASNSAIACQVEGAQ
jgi:hypothetical protein